MNRICILMTSYNPTSYLLDQINSIFNQKNVIVDIFIRDDASTIKYYLYKAKEKHRVEIIEGKKNLGTGGNIFELLNFASCNLRNYDFYAYCDQDDIWLSQKLYKASECLQKLDYNKPALYYSNLIVTDKDLNKLNMLFKKNIVKNTFGQSIGQVFLFACTSVFNISMIDEILKYDFNKIGFDSCLYYLGILNKNIYYDDNSYIYYRQHGNNVSGDHVQNLNYYTHKVIYYLKSNERSAMYKNSIFILENFKHYLSENEYSLLMKIISSKTLWQRFSLAIDSRLKVGYQPKDFFNFVKIILNKF